MAGSTFAGDNGDNVRAKAARANVETSKVTISSFCIIFLLLNRVEFDKLPSVT